MHHMTCLGTVTSISLSVARVAALAISLSVIPTAAHAQIENCIGPESTMETTDFAIQDGPMVPIDYWSEAEQNFLVDYQAQFLTQCMGLPAMSAADLRGGLYEQDGYENLMERARRICTGTTSGYGTNWDRFVANLNSFQGLCQGRSPASVKQGVL
jgi:hypothetical protein